MKKKAQVSKMLKRDSDFYRAFLGLERDRRRRVALSILGNQKVLADLYDHFLIQNALGESFAPSRPSGSSRRRVETS